MRAPVVAVAAGALGFWAAVRDVWPETRAERDWCHKLANVLDTPPKRLQPKAKRALREIMYAATREQAEEHLDRFVAEYEAKYPKAAACLDTDRERLLTHSAFPAEHWTHLRTTNVIESPFATVPLRQRVAKGAGSREGPTDGLQAARDGAATVASPQQRTPASTGSRRRDVRRWGSARTQNGGGSEGGRLITRIADPQLLTLSRLTFSPGSSKVAIIMVGLDLPAPSVHSAQCLAATYTNLTTASPAGIRCEAIHVNGRPQGVRCGSRLDGTIVVRLGSACRFLTRTFSAAC